ncbi:MAG: CHASE3 domain-containing protein [Rubrivivax sp.]
MKVATVIRRNPLVLALALAAAVVMVFISEGSYWRSVNTLNALGTMATARSSLQGLERSFLDAETGQRGFLLTERKEYLLPYDKALGEIDAALRFLERYYADEPEPMALLKQLRGVSDTRLSELALTIQLHQQGREAATRDIVLSDIGKEQMESIRALSAELLAKETARVVAARSDIYGTLLLSRIGIAALSAIGLLALVMYLRQGEALKLQEQQQKRLLQAERDRLEIEVMQRTAQLTELTRHLLTAREDERNRLARNLHDELGALLTSAKLDAARIRSRLSGTAPEALERLSHLVGTLNSSIALGRRIIEDLRPSTLGNLGLASALEILAREFADSIGKPVHSALHPVKLASSAELVIYRVVQEALTNISKHAAASQVWITLSASGGQVEVSVRDDGAGFDASVPPRSAYGLLGMRFRVEAEGGTFESNSAPGQGTLIRVRLPESTAAPG